MIPILIQHLALLIDRIRMHERTQGPAVYHQPRNEGAELRGREEVHFEHCYWVRADGSLPESVDAEFGDCGRGGEC